MINVYICIVGVINMSKNLVEHCFEYNGELERVFYAGDLCNYCHNCQIWIHIRALTEEEKKYEFCV
jgi:HKD family nuclease